LLHGETAGIGEAGYDLTIVALICVNAPLRRPDYRHSQQYRREMPAGNGSGYNMNCGQHLAFAETVQQAQP
jgi:hypothetical protein